MSFKTADLCDAHANDVLVAEPLFRAYGGVCAFTGAIVTVRVYEDNVLVRRALEGPGYGRVLVVDGGGSLRCALVGDMLAALAVENGWAGIIVNGCVRDIEALGQLALGIRALNANPLRSKKDGLGESNIPVTFAGVTFVPGHYVYADADGIIVSALLFES